MPKTLNKCSINLLSLCIIYVISYLYTLKNIQGRNEQTIFFVSLFFKCSFTDAGK